ncbi:hypothetical protein GUITHDRAFT_155532 [Guillardia theta CCMP2712]|uniref:Uncharacterized protein n=1 Tax=Guillardia theta (strain CCMP2712) TaxID=905079 RepID=L1IGU2_GUITC|nr:hypothetical protein GUITHDRAFT_155532 [Guillardia theta CCMP2712]EKX35277.1 hypothetical protein GUITHDRAFT_155532 [Guillardia theta CCMP2712]|eukprot:XP_005822257.1 hypothetical protein GUITHDRAFT_155532 [Guillardia theta CCMP2712]
MPLLLICMQIQFAGYVEHVEEDIDSRWLAYPPARVIVSSVSRSSLRGSPGWVSPPR